MPWVVENDLSAYLDRVLPWLKREPVLGNLPLTVLTVTRGSSEENQAWLAWLAEGGRVAGAAMRTPGRPLIVPSLASDAVDGLVELVLAEGLTPPGVVGPAPVADRFAQQWRTRSGQPVEIEMSERLYRLGALRSPDRARGGLRTARPADLDLLVDWFAAFTAEAGTAPPPDPAAMVQRGIDQRRIYLWELDGEPVCLVGHAPVVCGVGRIAPVYTPPEHRERGYASAATAGVSQRLLDGPAHTCVLFTDLANPTPNSVYQRLGYRPVADFRIWRFVPRSDRQQPEQPEHRAAAAPAPEGRSPDTGR